MEETKMQHLCWKLTRHRLRKRYDVFFKGRRYCRCRICWAYLLEDTK